MTTIYTHGTMGHQFMSLFPAWSTFTLPIHFLSTFIEHLLHARPGAKPGKFMHEIRQT